MARRSRASDSCNTGCPQSGVGRRGGLHSACRGTAHAAACAVVPEPPAAAGAGRARPPTVARVDAPRPPNDKKKVHEKRRGTAPYITAAVWLLL